MREIRTETLICAPAERVWKELTDFENYRRWNPFIRKISGTVVKGARLQIEAKLDDAFELKYRPRILVAEPNRELRWEGTVLAPGITGESLFLIEPVNARCVRFVHAESYHGLFAPALIPWLQPQIRLSFDLMNHALKIRAEQMENIAERTETLYIARPA